MRLTPLDSPCQITAIGFQQPIANFQFSILNYQFIFPGRAS